MDVIKLFGLISSETIQIIIVCDSFETADTIAKASYGNAAFAVETTEYPVIIHDDYINGCFMRDGVVIEKNKV